MYSHGHSDGAVSTRRGTSGFGPRVSIGTESERHANGDPRLPLGLMLGVLKPTAAPDAAEKRKETQRLARVQFG